jgi:hypothetical protein
MVKIIMLHSWWWCRNRWEWYCSLRELEEEAGIVVNEEYQLESLKPLFMSKGATQR